MHDVLLSEAFFKPNNGSSHAEVLSALHENPGCIGFHLCGVYQRNKARRRELRDDRSLAAPATSEIRMFHEEGTFYKLAYNLRQFRGPTD